MDTGGTRTESDRGEPPLFLGCLCSPISTPELFPVGSVLCGSRIPLVGGDKAILGLCSDSLCFAGKLVPKQGEGLKVPEGAGLAESRGGGGECPEEGEGEDRTEGAWLGMAPWGG